MKSKDSNSKKSVSYQKKDGRSPGLFSRDTRRLSMHSFLHILFYLTIVLFLLSLHCVISKLLHC